MYSFPVVLFRLSLKGRKQFCFPESAIVSPITSHNKNEAKSIGLHEKLNAIFSVSRSDKLSYPNNYGGAFIVDNDGGVVLVKEDLGQTKADLKKRLKSSAFQTQACDYSYQELLDFNEK